MGSRLDGIAITSTSHGKDSPMGLDDIPDPHPLPVRSVAALVWMLLASLALLLALSAIAMRLAAGPRLDAFVLVAAVVSASLLAFRLFIHFPGVSHSPATASPA